VVSGSETSTRETKLAAWAAEMGNYRSEARKARMQLVQVGGAAAAAPPGRCAGEGWRCRRSSARTRCRGSSARSWCGQVERLPLQLPTTCWAAACLLTPACLCAPQLQDEIRVMRSQDAALRLEVQAATQARLESERRRLEAEREAASFRTELHKVRGLVAGEWAGACGAAGG
jgi:hypothetical protein